MHCVFPERPGIIRLVTTVKFDILNTVIYFCQTCQLVVSSLVDNITIGQSSIGIESRERRCEVLIFVHNLETKGRHNLHEGRMDLQLVVEQLEHLRRNS